MMKHTPQRMCVACRTMINQSELLRVVKSNEDNKAMLDFEKKCFGRGAYVCNNIKCINLAKKKRAFERHLKTEIGEDLYNQLIVEAESE